MRHNDDERQREDCTSDRRPTEDGPSPHQPGGMDERCDSPRALEDDEDDKGDGYCWQEEVEECALKATCQPDEEQEQHRPDRRGEYDSLPRPAGIPLAESGPNER